MTQSNDTSGASSSPGSPSSSSPPPRSPVGEVASTLGATAMGIYAVDHLSSLLEKGLIDKTWGIALFALLVLPADVGLRIARRFLGGSKT